MTTNLPIVDAQNHLNGRQRGREARLARLSAAGVPLELAAMLNWLRRALDQKHVEEHGLFHSCTVRVSSGCDDDLPTKHNIGCRISRVPLKAIYYDVGTEFADLDEPLDAPMISVFYGNCGTGIMAPVQFSIASLESCGWTATGSADDDRDSACRFAENVCRQSLLNRGDCFQTREEAEIAVLKMLDKRAAR